MSSDSPICHDVGPASAADRYAMALGARLISADTGSAVVELVLEERHLNDRGIAHGGALFSLADVALSVASNSPGNVALVPMTTVHFLSPVSLGARLTAQARVEHRGRTIGLCSVEIRDGDKVVARMLGQSYAMPDWPPSADR